MHQSGLYTTEVYVINHYDSSQYKGILRRSRNADLSNEVLSGQIHYNSLLRSQEDLAGQGGYHPF